MGFSLGSAITGGLTGFLVGGPVGAAIGAGAGGLVGGYEEGKAEAAASAAQRGQQLGIEEQRRQFDLTRQDLLPYLEAGTGGLNRLNALLSGQADLSSDPLIQAQLAQAGKQAGRFASAAGTLGTGAFQKDLLRGTSDVYNTRINQLLNLAGIGRGTGAQLGAFGAQTSGNIANMLAQQGNIQAGLQIGKGQRAAGSLNQLFNLAGLARGGVAPTLSPGTPGAVNIGDYGQYTSPGYVGPYGSFK